MASEDLRERMVLNRCRLEGERSACYAEVDAILAEIIAAGYVIVRERAIGDALSDAIMEATRQGWDDPDSAIWRRGMAAGHRTLGLAWPGESEVGR